MATLSEIIEAQREFQKLAEVNIDTIVASEINALSEMYLFKAIEEIIELRKTFPSELNKWSKKQGEERRGEILAESSDVALFLINFLLARKIPIEDILAQLPVVQEMNFIKLKQKKMAILNEEMSRVPDRQIGFGGGNLMPAVIIIGQNPGKSLNDDQNCWDNAPKNSAVGFLKRAIKLGKDKLDLDESDIYFTNIVKEVTDGNSVPSYTQIKFWQPFLERELQIVSAGIKPVYLAMGKEAGRALMQEEFSRSWAPIQHPSYYMRNGFSEKQYLDQSLIPRLKPFLKEQDNDTDHRDSS